MDRNEEQFIWKGRIDELDEYFDKKKYNYDFAIFMLGKSDRIYAKLKSNSLCKNGYVSQVVKAKSIQKKVY